MYSLENLDVSDNEISGVAEVQHLRRLPCLAKLNLTSNPITLVVDYRIKILACFEARANEVSFRVRSELYEELEVRKPLLLLADESRWLSGNCSRNQPREHPDGFEKVPDKRHPLAQTTIRRKRRDGITAEFSG